MRFRSTPPCRGRPGAPPARLPGSISFDPRPRAGGDRSRHMAGPFFFGGFDPRPRAGGDRLNTTNRRASAMFRSTPPCRGRPPSYSPRCSPVRSFRSTPPCRGRPQVGLSNYLGWSVSIHAPVQGATYGPGFCSRYENGFRSTPPCRGRPITPLDGMIFVYVSIHAPVQGATAGAATRLTFTFWFRSTPPCRGRPCRTTPPT